MSNQGKIVIITAPSGSGKTSIARNLLARFPQLSFSVSATTRAPRNGEEHGREYYFLTIEAFEQKIREDAFLEWEMVYPGKYYGTLKSEMERIWGLGKVPLLDIDVKGAMNVQKIYPGQCLSLFIETPSLQELGKRLEARGTETAETLAMRLDKAEWESQYKKKFDTIIVNDDLTEATLQATQWVHSFLALSSKSV